MSTQILFWYFDVKPTFRLFPLAGLFVKHTFLGLTFLHEKKENSLVNPFNHTACVNIDLREQRSRRSHQKCSVKKMCFRKFCKIHRKPTLPENIFSLKLREKESLLYTFLPMNFVKNLRALFYRTLPGDFLRDSW